jgi:hypothetical protein
LDKIEWHEVLMIWPDPLLYDAYIRRFQSAAEREAEGKRKGYSRTLEASLLRGEEKLGRLRNGEVTGRVGEADDALGQLRYRAEAEGGLGKPKTAEEGREMWNAFLRRRFVDGLDDGGFDYDAVDGNEELDVLVRRDKEEEWFDDEPPEWAHDEGDVKGNGDEAEKDDTSVRRAEGETGIQDF